MKRSKHFFNLDGIMIVNKPVDMTSSEVVRRVKQWLNPKKIGHGGTLDPFAEGLLVLLINRGTKIADQFLDDDKTYEFTILFGYETDTLDRTGKILHTYDGPPVDRETLEKVLSQFRGNLKQRIPAYAAARVDGKRLYKLARQGITVEAPSKEVTVYELDLINYEWPRATFRARCSKGTYVRQLGADIARAAGCFGTLEHLIRTQSGRFSLQDAWTLEEVKSHIDAGQAERLLIPLADALDHLPAVSANGEEMEKLKHGQINHSLAVKAKEVVTSDHSPVRILNDTQDTLLALWWPQRGITHKRQLKVLI
jgi:tRNA pseudouridine55 synthase